jgi:hypothetical protein
MVCLRPPIGPRGQQAARRTRESVVGVALVRSATPRRLEPSTANDLGGQRGPCLDRPPDPRGLAAFGLADLQDSDCGQGRVDGLKGPLADWLRTDVRHPCCAAPPPATGCLPPWSPQGCCRVASRSVSGKTDRPKHSFPVTVQPGLITITDVPRLLRTPRPRDGGNTPLGIPHAP